jgi:hypothetical protein
MIQFYRYETGFGAGSRCGISMIILNKFRARSTGWDAVYAYLLLHLNCVRFFVLLKSNVVATNKKKTSFPKYSGHINLSIRAYRRNVFTRSFIIQVKEFGVSNSFPLHSVHNCKFVPMLCSVKDSKLSYEKH